MARGTVNNEPVVSQASTDAYRENYERIFGKDHKPQRGHWSFGSADDGEKAQNAPIMSGRFYENQSTVDGADIGSRRKFQRYMREKGVTHASDYSQGWYDSLNKTRRLEAKKERRETLERAFHDIDSGKLKRTRRTQDE